MISRTETIEREWNKTFIVVRWRLFGITFFKIKTQVMQ